MNKTFRISYKIYIVLIFILAFFLRLSFGLNFEFWFVDNIQIYLIGLKYFTTGIWPYWGPDVVFTHSSIPGALQGLLTGIPFYLIKIPEAPFIFLNILSLFSIFFFALYLSKRITSIPLHIILIWVLTIPSAMYYSTVVQNPSYVIIGAILFFISVFEIFPFYSKKILSEKLLFFLLGFSLLWIYQLHLSWILLIPYIILCFYFKFREKEKKIQIISPVIYFVLGSLICFATLVPTLICFTSTTQTLKDNVSFNIHSFLNIFDIIFNFFSYSTFEIEKFIPSDIIKNHRFSWFIATYYWVIPLVIFLLITRVIQFLYLIYSFWSRRAEEAWNKVQVFVIFTLGLLWFSFMFSEHFPNTHKFYLLMPISLWYSLQVYQKIYNTKIGRYFTYTFLTAGIFFYLLIMPIYVSLGRSLYSNRSIVEKAIREHDYTVLGIRRVSYSDERQNENTWQYFNSNDTSIFKTDLEYNLEYIVPQNITSRVSHSGKFSCKIDSIQPFGIAFERSVDTLYIQVNFSFFACSEFETNSVVVFCISDTNKTLFWNCLPIKFDLRNKLKWQEITGNFRFPDNLDPDSHAILQLYVWQPEKCNEVLFIDDIKLIFTKN